MEHEVIRAEDRRIGTGLPGPGRPRGVANKLTQQTRAVLVELASANAHRAQEWLDQVARDDPATALALYLRLLEYAVPKPQRADPKAEAAAEPLIINIHLGEKAEEAKKPEPFVFPRMNLD